MIYMQKYLIALLYFLTFTLILQAQAPVGTGEQFIIGGIEVEGLQFSEENAVIAVSGLAVDDKIQIPGNEIPDAIRGLWKLRLFTDIEISVNKKIEDVIYLTISVKERPRLSRYSYKGVKKHLHDDLNDEVQRFVQRGGIVTESVKMNTQNAIKEFFVERSFLDTEVKVVEIPDSTMFNAVRLIFNVDKKKRVRIKEINIAGNEELSDRKIRRLMKETKRKKHIFKPSKLIEESFEEDKRNVIARYNKLGYRDAQITRDSIYRIDNRMYIDMSIKEGNRYYFRDIAWRGNSIYTTEQLEEVLGIEKGDVYNEEVLNTRLSFSQDGRDVSSLYLDNGYLFFRVDPVEKMVENDSIDLEMQIFEGPQATIDRVVINGNDRTHEHVIRRELRTKPGQKFSRSDIIRSQREILALGYFSQENLGINTPVNPQRGTVDIEYTVEERPSDQLELSAGWGGRGRGVIGTLGVTFNNFSLRNLFDTESWSPLPQGDGQRLSLRAQTNGRYFQSYNMSFTEPWLGGKKPNSFNFSVFHSRSTNGAPRTSTILDEGGERREVDNVNYRRLAITGFSVGLGTRLKVPDDFFVSNTSISYQNIALKNYNGFTLEETRQPIRVGTYHNLTLNQTISRNSIDSPIFPTSGSSFTLSAKLSFPYSLFKKDNFWKLDDIEAQALISDYNNIQDANGLPDASPAKEAELIRDEQNATRYKMVEYHKWRFNAEWYSKIYGKFVVRAAAKIGMIGHYNKNIGTTPFERFELGGDGIANFNIEGKDIISLRGYEDGSIDISGNTFGATVFDKFTLELRYPLSLNPSATIYVLGFAEGGNAWTNFRDFNPLDLRRSAGLGLRVFLPMFGTLGFDYGVGFDKPYIDPETSKWSEYGRFSIILGFEPE